MTIEVRVLPEVVARGGRLMVKRPSAKIFADEGDFFRAVNGQFLMYLKFPYGAVNYLPSVIDNGPGHGGEVRYDRWNSAEVDAGEFFKADAVLYIGS